MKKILIFFLFLSFTFLVFIFFNRTHVVKKEKITGSERKEIELPGQEPVREKGVTSEREVIAGREIEDGWRSVTSEVIEVVEDFKDKVSLYSPELAEYLGMSLSTVTTKTFAEFIKRYREITGSGEREKLLTKLRDCKQRVFASLTAGMVKMAKFKLKDPLPPDFLKRNFGVVKDCSSRIILYSVKLFPSKKFEDQLQKYRKGAPLLEDSKLITKIPYVVIPMLFRITLTEVILHIDTFLTEKGLR